MQSKEVAYGYFFRPVCLPIGKLFCKGLNNKYFGLLGPHGHCHNYSIAHYSVKTAMENICIQIGMAVFQ